MKLLHFRFCQFLTAGLLRRQVPSLWRRVSLLLSALVALAGTGLTLAAPPVTSSALVTDVQGEVTLEQSGRSVQSTHPALLDTLQKGTRLHLGNQAHMVLVFEKNAKEYELSGPGYFEIDLAAPRALEGKAPTQKPLPVVFRQLQLSGKPLVQATLVMRDADSPQPRLSSPQQATTETQPTFHWEPIADAKAYKFQLVDQHGAVIFSQAELHTSSLKLPASLQLIPGQSYTWILKVVAQDDAVLTNSSEFTVLNRDTTRQLEAAKTALINSVDQSPGYLFSHRLLYTAMLERAELHEMAVAEWKDMMAQRKE